MEIDQIADREKTRAQRFSRYKLRRSQSSGKWYVLGIYRQKLNIDQAPGTTLLATSFETPAKAMIWTRKFIAGLVL